MRDAVQAMVDFSDETGRMASFGGIAFTDAKGNFAPRYVGREEWNKPVAFGEMQDPFGGVQFTNASGNVDVKHLEPNDWRKVKLGGLEEALPDVRQPETVTGAAVLWKSGRWTCARSPSEKAATGRGHVTGAARTLARPVSPSLFLAWHGDGDGVCVVGQLFPPLVALIPAVEIEAMHRVIGSVGHELKLQPIDMSAYFMIAGMVAEQAVQPFGPAPEMLEAA
jgi:hypothetical protein